MSWRRKAVTEKEKKTFTLLSSPFNRQTSERPIEFIHCGRGKRVKEKENERKKERRYF